MKKLFFWVSLISGVAAAYLMYRRGEKVQTIAKRAMTNPIGTLATELKATL